MRMYKINEIEGFFSREPKEEDFLFEIENVNITDLFKYKNKFYSLRIRNISENIGFLKEINVALNSIFYNEDDLKCPYCGFVDRNSSELYDEDDEHECGNCGAIISYERNISISYSSELVKAPDIIEVEQ